MLKNIKFNSTFRLMTGSEHTYFLPDGTKLLLSLENYKDQVIFMGTVKEWLRDYMENTYAIYQNFNDFGKVLLLNAERLSKEWEDSITIELLDPATQKYIKQLTIFYNKTN